MIAKGKIIEKLKNANNPEVQTHLFYILKSKSKIYL